MFSNGIIFLAVAAGLLIVVFKGNITALIPLYAFGVFTGFTLSQAGMVVHHFRAQGARSGGRRPLINGVGCVRHGVVALVVVVSKFTEGAWIPAVLIPLMVVVFRAIDTPLPQGRATPCRSSRATSPRRHTHTVVVLVGTRPQGRARRHPVRPRARTRPADRGVRRDRTGGAGAARTGVGAASTCRSRVHTILSPYRELTGPVLDYLDELDADSPDDVITVVIPEFVTQWKTQWLHNQSAFALKARLLYRPNTVVTSVPVLIDRFAEP